MVGFRISKRETVRESINRILTEQVDGILEHCRNRENDPHISIHEIRKSIKRIRAVLRLIREEIGYSSYYRENVFYRDISRSISDLRTYNVLILTIENIQSDLSESLPVESIGPLTDIVRNQRDKLLSEITSTEMVLRGLGELIKEGRSRIEDLPIKRNDFGAFKGGIRRMYGQGRDYLEAARKDPNINNLHDMRKRCKYLWYQVDIIKPIYPGLLKAFASSLESISERLGNYHDLAILSEFLAEEETGLEDHISQTLQDACEFKKTAMLSEAMRLASAAYTEEPKALIRRLGDYWKIYYRQIS